MHQLVGPPRREGTRIVQRLHGEEQERHRQQQELGQVHEPVVRGAGHVQPGHRDQVGDQGQRAQRLMPGAVVGDQVAEDQDLHEGAEPERRAAYPTAIRPADRED